MKTQTTTLLKALRDAGCGSRRELAEAVKAGRVAVNGTTAESFSAAITPADVITLDSRPVVTAESARVYLLLNKPLGVITTTEDPQGRPTVIDLLPPDWQQKRLFPVGRLDENTTGLIILTNDGELTNRLTHPRYGVEKEYLVGIDRSLNSEDFEKIKSGGLELDDGPASPARISPVNAAPFNYRISIHEGRKRIVRRLFAALGHQVRVLRRIRVGSLELGNLKEGNWRQLTPLELRRLEAVPRRPGRAGGRYQSASGDRPRNPRSR
ncbi:pseudouridine synthase [Dehalogenimonas lykanthroporepellens BL-DC-9]|jgi:23S rRNA pseudouridine2605 synthase|nr:pseudouridine synthase [Dehalogenimonas lykanthroporepellens BL-DC-9]